MSGKCTQAQQSPAIIWNVAFDFIFCLIGLQHYQLIRSISIQFICVCCVFAVRVCLCSALAFTFTWLFVDVRGIIILSIHHHSKDSIFPCALDWKLDSPWAHWIGFEFDNSVEYFPWIPPSLRNDVRCVFVSWRWYVQCYGISPIWWIFLNPIRHTVCVCVGLSAPAFSLPINKYSNCELKI